MALKPAIRKHCGGDGGGGSIIIIITKAENIERIQISSHIVHFILYPIYKYIYAQHIVYNFNDVQTNIPFMCTLSLLDLLLDEHNES